ncbi:MAG: hypothetical protein AB8B83_03695 [Bdellovibrionales bacterium]
MNQDVLASRIISETEYSIYVYLYPEDIENGHSDWEMKSVTTDVNDALHEAQSLFNSSHYKKVEVKRKYFDPKYNRLIDATFKVFQKHKRQSRRAKVLALLGLSSLACLGLVVVPFIGTF